MYFDDVALQWDTERRIKRAKILAKSITNKLNNTDKLTALEIGCGTGLISLELCNKFNKICCVDESQGMLNILIEKIERLDIKNIYPHEIEILNSMEFYGKFDVIYSSMVFHHISDIENELKTLRNLLSKDGYLIIIDLDKEDGSFHKEENDFSGHNGFDRSELKEIIEGCKFRDVDFDTVFEGEKIIDGQKINYSMFLCTAKY